MSGPFRLREQHGTQTARRRLKTSLFKDAQIRARKTKSGAVVGCYGRSQGFADGAAGKLRDGRRHAFEGCVGIGRGMIRPLPSAAWSASAMRTRCSFCYSTGTVIVPQSARCDIGGVVGWVDGKMFKAAMRREAWTSSANSTYQIFNIGGLGGHRAMTTVSDCYSTVRRRRVSAIHTGYLRRRCRLRAGRQRHATAMPRAIVQGDG